MGALNNNFDQEETSNSKDKSTGFGGSVFAAIIISTILSVFAVKYPTAMAWICGLLVLGGIGQVFKKDQSKQKRFQTLMITAASGFALFISIAALKAKSSTNLQSPTTQPQIVTVQPTNSGEYEPLKAEDIDQSKLIAIKKEMENKNQVSDKERNRQLQILKGYKEKNIGEKSLSKAEQFYNKLRMAGVGLETIEEVKADKDFPEDIKIIVANSWHSQPYQIRLQAAQNLQKLWGNTYGDADRSRVKLVDINGNSVGGNKVLGGVWVSDK